jgi:hypothetical protein
MFRILLAFFTLFTPSIVSAQSATYNLIAPIGTLTGAIDLKQYLEGIFQTVIGIAGILAVLMLVICGIKLMGTGSVAAKSEAKQCIWNAIFGLILAIGSWILLNTINPLLLKNDAQITVQSPSSPTTPAPTGSEPVPTVPGWYFRYKDANGNIKNSSRFDAVNPCIAVKNEQEQTNPGTVQKDAQGQECFEVRAVASSGTETSVRNTLCGNNSCVSNSNTNIYINNSPCPGVGSKGCTNVGGLPNSAISVIQSLQSTCGCKVVITGGTEYWLHKSHQANKPIFDLRKSPAVDNAIKSADPSSKRASFMNYEWLYNNFWFTDEGDHWHVCEVGTGPNYCRAKS